MDNTRTFTPSIRCGIEIICGPMFAGKTEELMRRVRRAEIAGYKIGLFKHSFDTRYSTEHVVSHDGNKLPVQLIHEPAELGKAAASVDLVGIDEVQFFPLEIVDIIRKLAETKRVILAGLDSDFRHEPFGPMAALLAIAERAMKLSAICTCCGGSAHFTQRLVNGNPARYDDPLIAIGGKEAYQPRCRRCYQPALK